MTSLVQPAYQGRLANARLEPIVPRVVQPARSLVARLMGAFDAWSQRMASERADARYLAAAMDDPRLMADLQRALDEGDPALAAPARAAIGRYQRGARAI